MAAIIRDIAGALRRAAAATALAYTDKVPLVRNGADGTAGLVSAGLGLVLRRALTKSDDITANGTYAIGLWPYEAQALTAVVIKTAGGTCTAQIRKNGTAIAAFSSAIAQTTTALSTAATSSVAENDYFDVVVASASALTGLAVAIKGQVT